MISTSMNLTQKLRLLVEWGPVLALASEVVSAEPGVARVQATLRVLDVVASKTQIREDDHLIELLRNVVNTEPGAAMIDWISDKVQAMFKEAPNVNA